MLGRASVALYGWKGSLDSISPWLPSHPLRSRRLMKDAVAQVPNFACTESYFYFSFFLARLAIISRISLPSLVRFITACCAMLIKLTTA
jgi:hypothetical protein